jgi:glycosyltransferase involved in cell wall biosynthesis
VVDAVEDALAPDCERIDLDHEHEDHRGRPPMISKTAFGLTAAIAGMRTRWDHVVCMHIGLLPVASVAARARDSRLVLVAHGTEAWVPMGPLVRRQIQRCTHVIAISTFTREWLIRRSGMDPRRCRLLPLPIARSLVTQASSAPRETREPLVLTVSRLLREHRYKGHFHVADAFKRVLSEIPEARWIVAGGGDDLEVLQRYCRDLRISDRVDFLGIVSDADLADVYRRAAVMALPSSADAESTPARGEGFGLVYAEAGAFGVPSIASTNGGGALDFVMHEQTGLTVPPGDPVALSQALVRLLTDDVSRARLGDRARRRTLENHWPDEFPAKLHAALEAPGAPLTTREVAGSKSAAPI